MTRSLPPSYFEALYASDPDPWRFASSDYERDKYAATLAALPRQLYRSGLEVGCSIGVLTAMLASRCRRLLAVDVADDSPGPGPRAMPGTAAGHAGAPADPR